MVLPKFIKKLFLFPILIIALLLINSLIDPFKISVDPIREDMNCPNTDTFDALAWANLSNWDHITYSTECYFLNWTMLSFLGLLSIFAIWGWLSK